MTPPTPGEGSLVTFTLQVNRAEIPTTIQVESIETWSTLGKVPRCRVVLFDGSAAQADFPHASGSHFLPGNRLEISAGYDHRAETVIFQGLIVRQGLEIQRDQASRLVVEAADRAIRMTLERRSGVFEALRDSELIEKLAQRHQLSAKVTATEAQHSEIVQYYASDWDLMMTRAEINGYVVSVKAGSIEAALPNTAQAPVLALSYGDSIIDLVTEMDATTQFADSAIRSVSWDPAQQEVVESKPGSVAVTEPGALSSAQLAKIFGVETLVRQTGATIAQVSLKTWSSAQLLKSKLSKIRGAVTFRGDARAEAGRTLQLEGLGASFDGKAYIGGVSHRIRDGSWTTTAQLGLSPHGFVTEAAHVAAPKASGQLPPISGLQTGIVQRVAKDPEGGARVLVNLPLLQHHDASGRGVWARLATFYASKTGGALFYPENGDEVIVGFMNEDPRFPVILGSVYSRKQPPPQALEEANDGKMIKTRSGLCISFDDQQAILRLTTPGGHSIELNDASKHVRLEDSNGNRGSFSDRGILLESPKGIDLRSRGDITVATAADLKISARGGATLDASQVTARAKGSLSARGNASTELTSNGTLTVKGSMVMIN